jgi:Family of unknown function (DUF5654)
MSAIEETKESYRAKAAALRRELVDKMGALATAAFGLVAALAWNNAVQAVFKRYYPAPDDPGAVLPLMGYALFVTIVAVLIMLWIGRASARLKHAERKAAASADKKPA